MDNYKHKTTIGKKHNTMYCYYHQFVYKLWFIILKISFIFYAKKYRCPTMFFYHHSTNYNEISLYHKTKVQD